MLDEAPLSCVPTDIIRLSNVEDVPIFIPSDIRLDGELDIAFLLFSCLGLGLKSVSKCISPGWSKPEDNTAVGNDTMRSSYNVLKLFHAFELDCSSLGLKLDIIAFFPCLTREDCSFLRYWLSVSDLDVPLNNTSSLASASERSEVSWVSQSLPLHRRRRALAGPHDGGGRVGLAFAPIP